MNLWLDDVCWNDQGLVPVIVQDYNSGKILMLAWMDKQALRLTAEQGHAVFWSRSRNKLWRKGEKSGHQQKIREIRLDCDEDVILLLVEQIGGIACHTGHERCFYRKLNNQQWESTEPVLKDPKSIYSK